MIKHQKKWQILFEGKQKNSLVLQGKNDYLRAFTLRILCVWYVVCLSGQRVCWKIRILIAHALSIEQGYIKLFSAGTEQAKCLCAFWGDKNNRRIWQSKMKIENNFIFSLEIQIKQRKKVIFFIVYSFLTLLLFWRSGQQKKNEKFEWKTKLKITQYRIAYAIL